MWLISGSDIKAMKTDVVMPFVKNMKTLIFWIEVRASEMDLATLKNKKCHFPREECHHFPLI